MTNWYEHHDNIAALARHMADNGAKPHEIAYMVGKPWKYGDEFSAMNGELGEMTGRVYCEQGGHLVPRADAHRLEMEGEPREIWLCDRCLDLMRDSARRAMNA